MMENGGGNGGNGEECCVKVAVHIRPLIADEKLQGCKDCVTVVHAKPQVILIKSFIILVIINNFAYIFH